MKKAAALYAIKKMATEFTFVAIVISLPVLFFLMLFIFATSVVDDASKLLVPTFTIVLCLAIWFIYGLFICYYEDYFIQRSAERRKGCVHDEA